MTPGTATRGRRVALLHRQLSFSGGTERLLATAGRLAEDGAEVTILAGDGSQRPRFESGPFALEVLDLPADPWRAPFAAWRARRALAELRPDLVHVASEELAGLYAWIAPTISAPYVLEVHRTPVRRIPRYAPRLAAVGISAPTLAEPVVNKGELARELLVEVRHAPRAPDGLEPAPFAHEGTLRIACSGRLDEVNGSETFVRAVERVGPLRRPCCFAILGEGPREEALRRMVRRLGLTDRLTLGVPVTKTTAATLASLDLHVSCRLEGGPDWIAHLALSMGIPSILSAVGSSFDLVEDEVSGILVEREDAATLARRMAQLAEAPLVARALGQRGRERWRALHPAEEFSQALRGLHARALGAAAV